MLAIIPSSSQSQPKLLHPNILPCSIKHSGPMRISKRYWNPRNQTLSKHLSKIDPTADDTSSSSPSSTKVPTAYLRGRKLLAKRLPLPANYSGHLLQKTNALVVSKPKARIPRPRDEEEVEDEEEEEEELPQEVKVVEEKGRFDEILVWAHESVPAEEEDVYVKGLGEWIGWAERVSCLPLLSCVLVVEADRDGGQIHAYDVPT
jgi:ribonuclease H2 subunit C